MNRPDGTRLELYRQSLERAWGYRDYNDWPVKLNSVFHLFLPAFGREFLDDLRFLLEEAHWPLVRVATLFANPARVYRAIDSVVYSMRRDRVPLVEQQRTVLTLLDMVRYLKCGSEFNEDGRNLVLNRSEARAEFLRLAGNPMDDLRDTALVHRLCGLLWAYTETIFFRAHDITKEIHGPYQADEFAGSLIVKDYLQLQPREIWERQALLDCGAIRVSLWYDSKSYLEIDALNHLYENGAESSRNHLVAYAVTADGVKLDRDELQRLVVRLGACIQKNCDLVDELSWHERVEKYAEIFWFRKGPLRAARGLHWKLPPAVRQEIRSGAPNAARLKDLSERDVIRLARLTI